jgi:flagellum-specific peptidoglycan hydrolase FlgJ
MLTPSQLDRLAAAAQSACLCEQTTGLPAEITVAQWAIESGWGASAPGNNCFGIKAYPGCQVQRFPTHEVIDGERKTLTLECATFDTAHGQPYCRSYVLGRCRAPSKWPGQRL